MWWGGSEGGQGGSPPPDPPLEQGDGNQGGGEDPAVIRQELGDLKDQFEEQQALIGQLKDMLKKKEGVLSNREKEVQDYTAKLARMKPRLGRRVSSKSKHSPGPSKESKVEESSGAAGALASAQESSDISTGAEALPPPSPSPSLDSTMGEERLSSPLREEGEPAIPSSPAEVRTIEEKRLSSSESSSRAKILLLRKQLQENRLKFQRQQKDDEKVAMEEMKQRIEQLRTEVEQRDDIIESLQEGKGSSQAEPSMQKLYQQIVYKDNTILELTHKITHLEGLIQDQQESLSEKDKIIEARTEAVSLVAKAQDEKGLKTLEELEEVRFQMKKMQEDFVSKEQEIITERDALAKELKDKVKKVNQLEDNGKRLENLRFEMSTRNAELQEKIVSLQSDTKSIREQSELERESYLEKDSLLQELKQKLVRAEAHGQKKLKALEKQLRSLKQDGNAGEQILELQNSIAELEEEKGNLQLKLVDFDDLKVTNEKLNSARSKLEDQVKQLNCDLDSQLSAITQLETEKIKLIEGINERENRIFDLESELTGLKTNMEEITQAKVTLDLRLCEVEEQRDTAEKMRLELENQMSESGRAPVEQLMSEKGSLEESLQVVMKERDEWEQKYLGQIEKVEECEKSAKSAAQEKDQKARECKRLMNILTDKENAIATFSIQIDKHDAVVAAVENKVRLANIETEKLHVEISNLNQNLQDHLQRLQAAHDTVTEKEEKLTVSAAELLSKESELSAAQSTIETLNRSVNEKNITVQNLVGEVSSLQEEVKLKEKSINDHINRLEELELQINDRDKDIERILSDMSGKEDQIACMNLEIETLKKDLVNTSKQFDINKSSLECELDALSAMLTDSKNQLEVSRKELQVKDQEIQNNQVIISKYEQEVCDKNQAFDELQNVYQDLQVKLATATTSLSDKETAILKLQSDIEEKTLLAEDLHKQLSLLEQKIGDHTEENKSLKDERLRLEEELHEKVFSLESLNSVLSEKAQLISHLESSLGSYTSELENKASEAEKWQNETLEKSEQVNALTLQLESLHSDSGCKDSLVSELKAQLTQNQEQIAELQTHIQQLEGQLAESQLGANQLQEQLSHVQSQLLQDQEHCKKLQFEFDASQLQLKETNLQYEQVTALASQFEEQLRMKATTLEAAEKQMASREESSTQELEQSRLEVTRLEAELKASKEHADKTQFTSVQLQDQLEQLQQELRDIKGAFEISQSQCESSREELEQKSHEMMQLQQFASEQQTSAVSLQEQLTQSVAYQQQYQQQLSSLQEELNQAHNLKQQSDSEIASLSVTQQQRITQLEGELLSAGQSRDQLQAELEKTHNEMQGQHSLVCDQRASLEGLTAQMTLKDAEIHALENKLLDLREVEDELKNQTKAMEEEKMQLVAKIQMLESSGPRDEITSPATDSETQALREELARALDQSKFLEEECDGLRGDANTLKQQLQDARQTITQLQTTLATQPQSSTAGGWDDWGEVDLGAPLPSSAEAPQQSSSLVSSLQKSLADKDEMLTMMQEQLKETLEEINTITEEKKVMEQQRVSAEANMAQKMEILKQEKEEEIGRLRTDMQDAVSLSNALEEEKMRISALEQELLEKQQIIEGLNQQLLHIPSYQQSMTDSSSVSADKAVPSAESEATNVVEERVVSSQVQETQQQQEGSGLFASLQWPQASSEADTAASWFDQPLGNQESIPTSDAQISSVQSQPQEGDAASWFDQEHIPADTQQMSELATASGTDTQEGHSQLQPSEGQGSVLQPSEGQGPVNVEELQYKLSWYEEQWSTWTAHYSQLQVSFQESEQRVVELSKQLEALQSGVSREGEMPGSAGDTTQGIGEGSESKPSESIGISVQEVQTRLIEAEQNLEGLREENQHLQLEANQVSELREQLKFLQDSAKDSARLEQAQAEVDHLSGFETQVYELQSQVQALQHQCTAMQNKLSESETEVSRLREVEALYGELQSCIQESETKREGSTSRVQELELMVQSAESEIARLRNEIDVLSQADQASGLGGDSQQSRLMGDVSELSSEVLRLQTEIERHQKDSSLFKNEVDKFQSESDFYKAEMTRLENENQNMGDEMERARSDLQRMQQENSQMRSELEVFEGELDRMRSACEMYESENNRVRGDYEALSQASQMTEAEKESLESEVQRITAQNMALSAESEHLRDEIQRLMEVSTSAETEISRLQTEMERFKSLDYQYHSLESKYNELQAHVTSMESAQSAKSTESEPQSLVVEEVDWGAEGQIEVEHRQRSSSVDLKYQEEIDDLKEKVISLEREKNAIYDELQAAKLKSGKMLQKLKLTQSKNESLTKEIQKLKAKAGGFSDLDQALEDEWRSQVAKAEAERDEFKQKLDEVENEKDKLITQVDVLTGAQEEYIEMKEDQDTTIKLLKARNKEVESQLQALEWRISELEEAVDQQEQQLPPGDVVKESIVPLKTSEQESQLGTSAVDKAASEEVALLTEQIASLQQEVERLKSDNERLQSIAKELEETIESLSHENETFQTVIEALKEAKAKAENDTSGYKSEYIELHNEHESLKKEKENANEEMRELTYTHHTLKAAYNSLYSEYEDLRAVSGNHKRDVGILKGERDRLVEEISSLKNQLQALHEEEEEETIRALQDECSSLREQNNLLHEENTALEVKTEDAIEKASRIENTLEQNVEMQKLLQDELMKKSEDISFHKTTIEGQERQMTYLKAEVAAMKTKLSQQEQAEESTLEATQALEAEIEKLREQNQQLLLQVEAAESSLSKLAGEGGESTDSVFTPPAPSTTEFEAALASLHLRDLRCQQLSLEITKLLEERDALQLKLSASLRQTQELSRELSLSHQLPAPVAPEPSLDQKLAELRELNDSLEQKALVSLKQGAASAGAGRRITVGGLSSPPIFTPHTAPPTPTATRHADYTLTREAQGTSSTLIDWIMGKSTPRVLHV